MEWELYTHWYDSNKSQISLQLLNLSQEMSSVYDGGIRNWTFNVFFLTASEMFTFIISLSKVTQ